MDSWKGYKKWFELNLKVPNNHSDRILPDPIVSFRCNVQIQWSLKGTDTELAMEKGGEIKTMPLFILSQNARWISVETYQKLFLEKVLRGNTSLLWLFTNHICEHRETKLITQITLTNALAFFLSDYIHGRWIRFDIICQKTPRELLHICQGEGIVYVIANDCCYCRMYKLAASQHLKQLLLVEKCSSSLKGQKLSKKEGGIILHWKDLGVYF